MRNILETHLSTFQMMLRIELQRPRQVNLKHKVAYNILQGDRRNKQTNKVKTKSEFPIQIRINLSCWIRIRIKV